MTRSPLLAPAAALAVMLGACAQPQDPTPAAPQPEATPTAPLAPPPTASTSVDTPPTQQLRCGELDIAFRPLAGSASLEIHGLSIPLTPVEAASGARYTGSSGAETVDFWSKGDTAQLTIGEREHPTCRPPDATLAPASDTDAVGSADASSYRASGNEPAWSLEVSGASMVLVLDAGQRRVKASPLMRITRDGVQQFAASADAGPLQATTTPELCRDSPSGVPRPDRVDVTLADEGWSGCGGDPASLLVGAEWQVVEVEGTPVMAGVPVSLQFQSDGSLSGQVSCNSLAGRFSMSGEGLGLSPLVTTKMACAEPVMKQEQAVLAILADAPKHDFDAQGRLLIRASGGEQLVAERE